MNTFVYAMLVAVTQAAVYIGSSPPESHMNMSQPEGQDWGGRSKTGAILGFTVFVAAYIATVISIFVDIRKSGVSYDQLIADDVQEIKNLGMTSNMTEINAELAIRLSGVKSEETGDDQLLGEALKLTLDQYKKYM